MTLREPAPRRDHWASERQVSELVLERLNAQRGAEPAVTEVAAGAAALLRVRATAPMTAQERRQAAAAVLRAARRPA